MPATTHVVLELEIWDGGAAGTADFDEVQLLEGPCRSSARDHLRGGHLRHLRGGPDALRDDLHRPQRLGHELRRLRLRLRRRAALYRRRLRHGRDGQRLVGRARGVDRHHHHQHDPLAGHRGDGRERVDVSTPTASRPGQFIFLHQSQGAGVGAWEIAEVTAVAGTRLTVRAPSPTRTTAPAPTAPRPS